MLIIIDNNIAHTAIILSFSRNFALITDSLEFSTTRHSTRDAVRARRAANHCRRRRYIAGILSYLHLFFGLVHIGDRIFCKGNTT